MSPARAWSLMLGLVITIKEKGRFYKRPFDNPTHFKVW